MCACVFLCKTKVLLSLLFLPDISLVTFLYIIQIYKIWDSFISFLFFKVVIAWIIIFIWRHFEQHSKITINNFINFKHLWKHEKKKKTNKYEKYENKRAQITVGGIVYGSEISMWEIKLKRIILWIVIISCHKKPERNISEQMYSGWNQRFVITYYIKTKIVQW